MTAPSAMQPLPNAAYCIHERKHSTITNPEVFTAKNGRRMLKGPCASCGKTITRILAKA